MYKGNIITKTPPTTSTISASGIWRKEDALVAKAAGQWPSQQLNDPYFSNVVLLLTGDGTNGAQNNTFIDGSTNNYTITRNGNATQGTFSPFSNTGWSGHFTGSSTSYVTTAATSVADQGGAYTVQCWIYPTAFTTSTSAVRRMYVFVKGVIYAGLSIHSDGTLGWYGWPTPGGIIVSSPAGTITTNSWQHIALVVSPTSYVKLFKNGVEVGSSSYTAAGANGSAIQIGNGDTSQATDGFIGYISNFKVTSSALTGAQLDYSATPTQSSPAGAQLLTLQSNRFIDTSGSNLAVVPAAAASIQSFTPFAPSQPYSAATNGGSAYLDGSGDFLNFSGVSFTSDFTIEGWVYKTATNASGYSNFFYGTGNTQVAYDSGGVGSVSMVINGSVVVGTSGTAVTTNAWNHIAYVREGSTCRIYVNGVQQGTGTNSSSFPISQIGRYHTGGYEVNGFISGIRLVAGTCLYPSGTTFTPPTTPPTAVTNTQLLLNFTNAGIGDTAAKTVLDTIDNVQINTTTKKFGTGSIAFDGTGDYLYAQRGLFSPLLKFGTENFTMEGWFYFNSVASRGSIINTGWSETNYATQGGFTLDIAGTASGTLAFALGTMNAGAFWMAGLGTFTTGVWYHIALVRNGTNISIYQDGISIGSNTLTNSSVLVANLGTLYVGAYGGGSLAFNGFCDDFRITKGIARYTTNFTPPTQAFPLF